MRRIVSALLVGFLTGCSGSEPSSPPPPPPAPGPPASLQVQAGDAQQAGPGSAVPVAPKVLVRDAAGRPVAGTSVAFAVDSGAGAVSTATATTGSDGTASTTWTLGPAEGVNTLVASVASLTPVRFRATGRIVIQTLIDTSTVPATGGTLSYRLAGDSLSGVSLTVFDSTFQGPSRFRIVADRSTHVPLPPNVRQMGPVFVVGMDSAFAARPIALRLPARGQDAVVAAFFYDPASGTLEGIPLVARDDSSIVIISRHFRTDQLMVNARASATARPGLSRLAAPAFGQVLIVGVTAPRTVITAPVTTGFSVGADNWEFVNNGTYPDPGGICSGMSVTSMYYYSQLRGQGRLYHHFDTFNGLEWDDPVGEAIATQIQHQSNWQTLWGNIGVILNFWLPPGASGQYDQLAYESLALTMQVTRQPQYLAIYSSNHKAGHAIVAYGVNNGAIPFADPNYPATPRTATYDVTLASFDPIPLSTNASAPTLLFPNVYFVGTSAMINTTSIAATFAAAAQGTILGQVFPRPVREYFDVSSSTWAAVPSGDSIKTTHRQLALRTRCPSGCPLVTPRFDRITTVVRDTANNVLALDPVYADTAAVFVFGRGLGSFRVSWENFVDGVAAGPDLPPEDPASNYSQSYVGQTFLTVVTIPFFIKPGPAIGAPNVDITFTASSGSLPVATSTYVWDFGDGTPVVSKLADSVVKHHWAKAGTYTMTAELRDSKGQQLAADQTTVTIGGKFVITPKPDTTSVLTDLTLTASSTGYPVANLLYVWDFGDNTPLVTNRADSVATHQWTAAGTYTVRAQIRDLQNNVLTSDNATVLVSPIFGWMFQSATIQTAQLAPLAGLGPESSDTVIYQLAQRWLADLQSPSTTTGLIAGGNLLTGPACSGGVVISQYPNAVWVPPAKLQPQDVRGLLAVCGDSDYSGSFTMGPLGSGALVGSAQSLHPPDTIEFEGGSINATMAGKTLTGTFTALIQYSNGNGSIKASFVARQVYP